MTAGDLTRQFQKDDWIRLSHEGEERLGIIYYGETVGNSNVKRYALVFNEEELEEIDDG